MKTLIVATQLDHSPKQSVFVYVSSQFNEDPSDEMPGGLNTELEVDLDALDLGYADLYFIS
jgi:hypothetical protein